MDYNKLYNNIKVLTNIKCETIEINNTKINSIAQAEEETEDNNIIISKAYLEERLNKLLQDLNN